MSQTEQMERSGSYPSMTRGPLQRAQGDAPDYRLAGQISAEATSQVTTALAIKTRRNRNMATPSYWVDLSAAGEI